MVIATNSRPPQRHTHHRGDRRNDYPPGTIKGPNTENRLVTVVECTYDQLTDTTTVGWDWTRLEDYPGHEDYVWGNHAH